ncbi:MAG: hypothetical protein QGG36_11565 [Pirellulaceae bacterium]|nr:hypothetical protein [Pirellulaceae bacterium]
MMDDETVGPIEETVFIEKLRSGEIKPAWMVGGPQATGGQWTKAHCLSASRFNAGRVRCCTLSTAPRRERGTGSIRRRHISGHLRSNSSSRSFGVWPQPGACVSK